MKGVFVRYFICEVDSNTLFKPVYYISANEWFTDVDLISILMETIREDFLAAQEDELGDSDDEDISCGISDIHDIPADEYMCAACDRNYMEHLSLMHLDSMDCILTIGRMHDDIPDVKHFVFMADAGQEQDVVSFGVVDHNISTEQCIHDGYLDCLQQLKRYFSVSGLNICTGTFTKQLISEDDYEFEKKSREIVFD